MGKLVGIDLGTTTSALSYLNAVGKPEVVANADGERIMPSAVYFDGGNILTGKEALNARHDKADHGVRWIKRHMGDVNYTVTIDGKKYTPAEISSQIIKKLVNDAVAQVGPIDEVLITVPANFEDAARRATMNAGEIAGVKVLGLVNEPTAAAYYYSVVYKVQGNTLIFDLGGGTLDITIAEISGKDIKIVTSNGDRNLGGYDFDQCLVKYFEEFYSQQTDGEKLCNTDEERTEIEEYAEEIKCSLSKRESVPFRLSGDGGIVKGEMTRDKYKQLISNELQKIQMLIETTLDEAEKVPDDIDNVILVGGSTRLSAVKELLTDIFHKEPQTTGNVDEVVSLGAGLCAADRKMSQNPQKLPLQIAKSLSNAPVLRDVCNHSYGTLCKGDKTDTLENSIIIPKNSPIPCKISKEYYTDGDNQRAVDWRITQGEDTDPRFVTIIAQKKVQLPPGLPENTPIIVTYSYDENQRMKCEFELEEYEIRICVDVDMKQQDDAANAKSRMKLNKMKLM